jgi:hypothetical protein
MIHQDETSNICYLSSFILVISVSISLLSDIIVIITIIPDSNDTLITVITMSRWAVPKVTAGNSHCLLHAVLLNVHVVRVLHPPQLSDRQSTRCPTRKTRVFKHTPTPTETHIHTHAHTCTQTHTHTHVHTHTHTHTPSPSPSHSLSLSLPLSLSFSRHVLFFSQPDVCNSRSNAGERGYMSRGAPDVRQHLKPRLRPPFQRPAPPKGHINAANDS